MKLLLTLTFILSTILISSQEDYYNEKLYDSLSKLSTIELVDMAKSGYDFNKAIAIYPEYNEDENAEQTFYTSTAFQSVTHGYGYWCDDELKELVYGIATHSKEKLLHPFYFFNDPCGDRVSDILIYYSLLKSKDYFTSEIEFEEIIDIYYYGYAGARGDLKNDEGKTPLMYAIAFGYEKSISKLLKQKLDLSIEDKEGKNVLIYACEQDNLALIKRFINTKVPAKTSKLSAIDHCISKDAKKLLKKYKN